MKLEISKLNYFKIVILTVLACNLSLGSVVYFVVSFFSNLYYFVLFLFALSSFLSVLDGDRDLIFKKIPISIKFDVYFFPSCFEK